jgi:hypothetical protein
MLRTEFGHDGPYVRIAECSYFSVFFLAEHTLISEIFVAGKGAFPIATT